MGQQERMRVGLVYGGKSGEHEVSLSTAFAVMQEFNYDKYEIIPFYITKQGQWRVGDTRHEPFANKEELTLESGEGRTVQAMAMLFANLDRAASGDAVSSGVDVMFPLLHGTYGEDGTIQGLFEMANVPYVGAGVLASATGMDKAVMKQLFTHAGLPQCKYTDFIRVQWEKEQDALLAKMEAELGYPCFVKPANLGSSVGISKARNRQELIEAVQFALRYDRKIVVEEFVDAREIEVSVLGNDEPQGSLPGEIVSSNEFYDYKAKYLDGKSQMVIPAPIEDALLESIRQMAVTAYRAIDGSGLSRVDFFVRRSDMQVFINEVNTLPGFTPFSMYPQMWKESGLPYNELLDRLLQLAMDRFEAKQGLQYENA
ncbi:D-alanine--D-alanine ligase [Paenibacillus sp. 481]|uniref:D-alanine--D-alanine ligase n=1 Tax=Paenibacillus sp. 481 TaxID=2835869 RepID=UPI001E621295|nr:D-alanine--D-alanine ligase [Paenibacillus sp. 481]UHA74864.1 D-alanine--D-alanine ligase [Paenibacillus sp. 481]